MSSPNSGRSPTSSSPSTPQRKSGSKSPKSSPSPQKSNLKPTSPCSASTSRQTSRKLECPACEDVEEEFGETLNSSQVGRPDAVNTEFVYYSATLREVAPRLTSELDRQLVIPWIRKLFRPEYHSSRFRDKRNKFLLYLTLTIMNDETHGIFHLVPPAGALPPFESLGSEEPAWPPAEWERDTMWRDVLQGLPEEKRRMGCSIHVNQTQCDQDKDASRQLDEEFMFLLYLARPFAVLLRSSEDRTRIAAWLQTLCTVRENSCSEMKRLRNEYLTAILGYIHELRVAGPFMEFPCWESLPPLPEAARIVAQRHPSIDPCSSEASEFLEAQPVPAEGAFCYIAVTGELLDSSLNELD